MIELQMQSRSCRFSVNPLVWSVQSDEDFIGRPSRLSRRVSPVTVVQRVTQRYLQGAYAEWVRARLIVEPS